MYFEISDAYTTASNTCRQRITSFIKKHFQETPSTSNQQSKPVDDYLNIVDDFKTNLMWLSVFVRSVEGVGMRLPVNYRTVLQSNYSTKDENGATIKEAVSEPDGDTFQNSPVKLVFFAGFHKKGEGTMDMTSISKVSVDPKKTKLSPNLTYSNMTLVLKGIQCLWPRQEDLQGFLYLLGYHPITNLGAGNHDFPWNEILMKFNKKDMQNPNVLLYMLHELSLGFLHNSNKNDTENLATLRNFIQFMTPIFSSAVEGDHRIELANRLLYGIGLSQQAPFIEKTGPSTLPFNSTVHKPILAEVYLPAKGSSSLCVAVISHLMHLSRKTADQKTLFIRDNWRSLYQSIFTALEQDVEFEATLYKTQKERYEEPLQVRQETDCKARKNRARLSVVIADVIFRENPTCDLAAKSKTANIGQWKAGLSDRSWTGIDTNPFTSVC